MASQCHDSYHLLSSQYTYGLNVGVNFKIQTENQLKIYENVILR